MAHVDIFQKEHILDKQDNAKVFFAKETEEEVVNDNPELGRYE